MGDLGEVLSLEDLVFEHLAESGAGAFRHLSRRLPEEVFVEALQLVVDAGKLLPSEALGVGSAIRLQSIESIRLSGVQLPPTALLSLAQEAKLSELVLDRLVFPPSTSESPKQAEVNELDSLVINRGRNLHPLAVLTICRCCTGLTSLGISASHLSTESATAAIVGVLDKGRSRTKYLSFLDFSGNPAIGGMFSAARAQAAPAAAEPLLPGLQFLSLANCTLAAGDCAEIEALIELAPRVQELDLSRTSLRDEQLQLLVKKLPELHRLSIGGSAVTGKGLREMVRFFLSKKASVAETLAKNAASDGAGAAGGGGEIGAGVMDIDGHKGMRDSSIGESMLLQALDASDLGLKDEDVRALGGCKGLEWLRLDGNRAVGQEALETIAEELACTLRYMSAAATSMTDKDAVTVAAAAALDAMHGDGSMEPTRAAEQSRGAIASCVSDVPSGAADELIDDDDHTLRVNDVDGALFWKAM